MSDEEGTKRWEIRSGGVAASAASRSRGARTYAGAVPPKERKAPKIAKVMRYGAKRCIRESASLSRFICNLSAILALPILRNHPHHATPRKTLKNGAFGCILVHGRRETSKFGKFPGFSASNDAPWKRERVVHLMHGDACRHACGVKKPWVDISTPNCQSVRGVSVPHPNKSHMGRW